VTAPGAPGLRHDADPPGSEGGFAALDAAFQEAAAVRHDLLTESHHVFGGLGVRIRLVGRRLARSFSAPFDHLAVREGERVVPRLAIDLWDEEETGIPCPLTAHDGQDKQGWDVGGGTFTLSPDRRFAGFRFRESLTGFDRKVERIVGAQAGSDRLSLYERGKPLHVLLTMWYSDRGIQLVHSGLVGRNGQGVLLPGRGGVGKSTSALACLSAGFDYAGDDYVGVEALGSGRFGAHSVFGSTWLEPAQLKRFPVLASHAIEGLYPWERKPLVLLAPLFPQRLVRGASIRALALPRIVDADATRFRPAARAEALLEIVPSSLLDQLLRPGAQGFRRLTELVDGVPTYWLELGRDLEGIPPAVEALLEDATRG
jgi:hypothetical protein